MNKDVTKYVIEMPDDIPLNPQFIEVFGTEVIGNKIRTYTIEMDEAEELNSEYIKENYSGLLDDAYQKGVEDGKAINDKGCEGCKYQANKELTCPCSECANNYKNQWTAKSPIDDGFVRGDVVVDEEDGTRGIVVSSKNNESNLLYVLFKGYRVPQSVVRKHYKKTGEHYDIDKYLEEINRSKTDDVC